MPWSIADKVDNIFDESDYLLKIESVKWTAPKEGKEGPGRLTIRLKVVSDGKFAGQSTMMGFPLEPDYMGLLGDFLQGSNAFDRAEKNIPDGGQELADFIGARIGGKVYKCEYTVRESKDGRRFPNVRILEEFSADAT